MREALGIVGLVCLLVGSQWGCGPKAECRAAQGACAATIDCCDGLICERNACVSPSSTPPPNGLICGDGSCGQGETQGNCCEDCGCPSTQQCKAGTCQATGTGAMCGNGKCEAGESSSNCCRDCSCASPQVCNTNTNTCGSPAPSLSWTVVHNCFNGESIQYRFFDTTARLVWPSSTEVYLIASGASQTRSLGCTLGHTICLGANQPGHGLSWGLGIDATSTCGSCCFTCATASVGIGPLVCN